MTSFEEELKDRIGTRRLVSLEGASIGGGCINQVKGYQIDDGSRIFVKRNKDETARLMFDGEYESLKCIQLTETIRCPKPITVLDDPTPNDVASAIVMEYINIGTLTSDKGFVLGQKLAKLHKYNEQAEKHEERLSKWIGKRIPIDSDSNKATSTLNDLSIQDDIILKAYDQQKPKDSTEDNEDFIKELPLKAQDRFGFHVPTSCGAIPQLNEWCDDWVVFFARNRLDHQIQSLEQDYGDRELRENWSKLQLNIDKFFKEFKTKENKIKPALLHGDLWSGNVGIDLDSDQQDGVIYDPCSFYGHHEYDFGIATMFGGIPGTLYDGYFTQYKKSINFDKRNKLYQLFHQVNHWNHFGKGYRASTISLIKTLNDMKF